MSVYYRDKNGDDTLISGMAPITNNITDGDMAAVTSNAVADALANKQNKTDNNLTTISKTTTGAINELSDRIWFDCHIINVITGLSETGVDISYSTNASFAMMLITNDAKVATLTKVSEQVPVLTMLSGEFANKYISSTNTLIRLGTNVRLFVEYTSSENISFTTYVP